MHRPMGGQTGTKGMMTYRPSWGDDAKLTVHKVMLVAHDRAIA